MQKKVIQRKKRKSLQIYREAEAKKESFLSKMKKERDESRTWPIMRFFNIQNVNFFHATMA